MISTLKGLKTVITSRRGSFKVGWVIQMSFYWSLNLLSVVSDRTSMSSETFVLHFLSRNHVHFLRVARRRRSVAVFN